MRPVSAACNAVSFAFVVVVCRTHCEFCLNGQTAWLLILHSFGEKLPNSTIACDSLKHENIGGRICL